MASVISAGTTSGTALNMSGDTTGNLQLQTQAGANTISVPNATGTMMVSGNMPAFSAYQNAGGQSIPSASTKVIFDTEEFDTASCFNTSNYRFTPNVSGYYQINAQISYDPLTANEVVIFLFKNGSEFKRGQRSQASGQALYLLVSTIVYANGTTDYFEIYTYQSTGSNKVLEAGLVARGNYFQGSLVRAA
jgi:hypothetical protein